MKSKTRTLFATLSLFAASGLGVWGAVASPQGGGVAQAAAPITGVQFIAQSPLGQNGVRRESGPTAPNGQPPRTGPASPFRPLVDPVFGDNYRANTDTQSPNRAQQEPSISVNPTNPLNVVSMAKDERGGQNTKQTWIYTSTDGGVTWINQIFPFAPQSPFSSDPIVSFSDDGICYVTSLPYGGGSADGIQVAQSTDGGITFTPGVHLPGTNGSTDKEWTWVDNNLGSPFYHRIYTAWMDFGTGNGWRLNYSSDRGVTFSAASGFTSASQFPMPVALPNGDVIVSYVVGAGVSYRRSTDGGVTFGGVQTISSITGPRCPPDNSGCGIWRLNAIPANSVNRTNGTMVVVWADGRASPSNTATIYFTRSTDNGATWSPAAILASPGVTNTYQVEPWVEADEQGNFHAIWYDDRENPNTSIFNIYYSQSTDNGATWSTATRISTATSDLRIGIPSSYSLAAGDYINVTASHGNVYGVWTDTRQGSGEDIYVVRGVYSGGSPTPTPSGGVPTSTSTSTAAIPTATATRTNTSVVPSATSTNTIAAPTATRTNTAIASPTTAATAIASPTSSGPTATCVPAGGIQDVAISSFAFTPPNVTIPAGTTVRWTVNDGTHTTTSDTGVWDSGVLAVDDQFSFTFNTPGTYSYHCLIHPALMSGTITVLPASPCATATTHATNTVAPTITPGGPTETPIPTATACTITFSDVPVDDPFYTFIRCLACRGVVSGYSDNTFRPGNDITRGQIAKMVSNAAGFEEDPGPQVYEDVDQTNPFYQWINRLSNRGFMGGYPCGTIDPEPCVPPGNRPYFRPFANATRGQLSKIVASAAGVGGTPTGLYYTDVPEDNPFYLWIMRLTNIGVMSGYDCGGPGEPCDDQQRPYFRPFANVTRGQASKIVANTFFPDCQTPSHK